MPGSKAVFGLLSLVIGISAFVLAASLGTGGLLYQKEPVPLAERGLELLENMATGKSESGSEASRQVKISNVAVFSLGIGSLILGILSMFSHKPSDSESWGGKLYSSFSAGGAGLTLATLALFWNYVVIAVIIALIVTAVCGLVSGA